MIREPLREPSRSWSVTACMACIAAFVNERTVVTTALVSAALLPTGIDDYGSSEPGRPCHAQADQADAARAVEDLSAELLSRAEFGHLAQNLVRADT